MRRAVDDAPFEKIGGGSSGIPAPVYAYFLHLKGGDNGIRDLSGNPFDFQSLGVARDNLVIPFTLDARKKGETPLFPDNLVVTVARRFVAKDEDEQPLELPGRTVQDQPGVPSLPAAGPVRSSDLPRRRHHGWAADLTDHEDRRRPQPAAGAAAVGRQRSESTGVLSVHDRLGYAGGHGNGTGPLRRAAAESAQPIRLPLADDLARDRHERVGAPTPIDFNLDVEQMYWAPFTATPIVFDEFDRESLFLGHSEFRTEPCVGSGSSLPSMTNSGLKNSFDNNYVLNLTPSGDRESQPAAHPEYVDHNHGISPNLAFTEPNGVHRYLPLPTFEKPYFVWRDETVVEQGGNSNEGRDTKVPSGNSYIPHIISPFLAGRGRFAVADGPEKVLRLLGPGTAVPTSRSSPVRPRALHRRAGRSRCVAAAGRLLDLPRQGRPADRQSVPGFRCERLAGGARRAIVADAGVPCLLSWRSGQQRHHHRGSRPAGVGPSVGRHQRPRRPQDRSLRQHGLLGDGRLPQTADGRDLRFRRDHQSASDAARREEDSGRVATRIRVWDHTSAMLCRRRSGRCSATPSNRCSSNFLVAPP